MALKVARCLALLFAALALTMTSAHVLELPPKLRYDLPFYVAVNGTLYRYFAIVGAFYTLAAIASAWALVWLARGRHPAFEWSVLGALFVSAAFVSWLVLVAPVNAEVARTLADAPGSLVEVWSRLRERWEYGHLTGFVLQLIGFCALVVSAVVETPKQAPRPGPVYTQVSELIYAPRERVMAIYADYRAWPRVFAETIRGVHLLDEKGPEKTLEIDHVEGRVINVMSQLTDEEILLEEEKKRYWARFHNVFQAVPEGTLCSVRAEVTLKGPLAALSFIAKPIVRARIRRFVLEPLREVAEQAASPRFTRS